MAGSINVDLLVEVPHLPVRGETVAARRLHQQVGGKGANQAVAGARAGARVVLYGCVGDDVWGERALSYLREEQVETGFVRVTPGETTGLAVITVDKDGHNTIAVVPGANGSLPDSLPPDLSEAMPSFAAVVVQFEIPSPALGALYRRVEQVRCSHGVRAPRLIVNPSPLVRQSLPDPGLADLLIVNEVEASELSGVDVADPRRAALAARRLAESVRPGGAVVVTLGPQGAVVWEVSGACWHVPALPVRAVDSTGAGDVFTGVLVAALISGRGLVAAARLAVAASGLCVTRHGVQQAIPRRADIERALARVPGPVLLAE
ncbi:ribokinase [Geochorda subterranea]|uniref:Ribokinase n=1 Tax=Geochorda subterranea TaxID=3109564 RepID=A0ABZ1BSR3_9FIRM|nr:ribokinase [Limnochorda sp. LNt]WRP15645.1 ribokinase [Limnochorda sp. LNt]